MHSNVSQHPPFYHLKWGIVFILLAWLAFTIMATTSRIVTESVPVAIVIFFQNFISWLTIIPWIFLHGVGILKTKRFGLIAVRSIGGLFAFALLFLSVQRISLVDAILLNNAAPLIVPFAIWIWLKIPINHKLWPGILVGFLGIIFILKPGVGMFNSGAFYAIGAALCLSVVMIAVRLLSYTERHHTVLFYYFAIASALCLPFIFVFWQSMNVVQWAQIILIGLLSAFGQWCFMRAFHHGKPSQLSPFCYMAVVYSAFIEWILWGKIPDLFACLGILLVCMGGIWTIRLSKPPPNN